MDNRIRLKSIPISMCIECNQTYRELLIQRDLLLHTLADLTTYSSEVQSLCTCGCVDQLFTKAVINAEQVLKNYNNK